MDLFERRRLEGDIAVLCAQLDAERALIRELLLVIRLSPYSVRFRHLPDPVAVPAPRRSVEQMTRRSR